MERKKIKKAKYKVVSLFAGIGGMDLGFDYAGFDVIWANDFDKYAVATYKRNINDNILLGDIRDVKGNIPKHDVLIGGFPCQPFSTLGKLKGFEDESRGTLFFEIKEILLKNSTKVVVLENVKNIINHNKGATFTQILKELDEIGYDCFYQVLNSQDYGVPQRRNRVFLIALNRTNFPTSNFSFPKKQTLNGDTQSILDKHVDKKYFLTKKLEKTILGYGTKGYQVKPTIDLPISKPLTATMHKMHRASQDNYFTDLDSWTEFIDDNRIPIRKLTPNECRKLQGFPNDWIQEVSDTQAYKQFGNAVTVNVSYAVASELMKCMKTYMK